MIADVLRQATAVQVNQAGGPGSQTSVVIRGVWRKSNEPGEERRPRGRPVQKAATLP